MLIHASTLPLLQGLRLAWGSGQVPVNSHRQASTFPLLQSLHLAWGSALSPWLRPFLSLLCLTHQPRLLRCGRSARRPSRRARAQLRRTRIRAGRRQQRSNRAGLRSARLALQARFRAGVRVEAHVSGISTDSITAWLPWAYSRQTSAASQKHRTRTA